MVTITCGPKLPDHKRGTELQQPLRFACQPLSRSRQADGGSGTLVIRSASGGGGMIRRHVSVFSQPGVLPALPLQPLHSTPPRHSLPCPDIRVAQMKRLPSLLLDRLTRQTGTARFVAARSRLLCTFFPVGVQRSRLATSGHILRASPGKELRKLAGVENPMHEVHMLAFRSACLLRRQTTGHS